MTRSLRILLPAVCLTLATTAFAQTPTPPAGTPPAGQQQRPRGPRPAPTNLKVLPKDTTGDQVIEIMHGYTGALGVECEFCHARNPETKRNNFPSDANPVKDRARVMIKMTQTINAEYLSQLNNPKPENPVTCGTCHRGSSHPTVFVPKEEQRPPMQATPPASTPK
jgi:Photosynthetic reaction centre cytochrome C subunit